MAMRKSIRRELNKGRELLWHLLEGKKCCYCKELLVPNHKIPYKCFGTSQAAPMDIQITIEHLDQKNNPRNQEQSNRALCHTSCHKRHTIKLQRPCDKRKSVLAIRNAA